MRLWLLAVVLGLGLASAVQAQIPGVPALEPPRDPLIMQRLDNLERQNAQLQQELESTRKLLDQVNRFLLDLRPKLGRYERLELQLADLESDIDNIADWLDRYEDDDDDDDLWDRLEKTPMGRILDELADDVEDNEDKDSDDDKKELKNLDKFVRERRRERERERSRQRVRTYTPSAEEYTPDEIFDEGRPLGKSPKSKTDLWAK